MELPEYVDATSPAGRAILDEVRIHLGSGDVKDAFHRFRLRESLAAYFCMGTAKAHELGLTGSELHGHILGDVDTVDICWGSLPMGFSWSLLFRQHVVSGIAERSLNCPESVLMRDRQPPAIFRVRQGPSEVEVVGQAHYVYVDNLGVASGSRRDTDSGL